MNIEHLIQQYGLVAILLGAGFEGEAAVLAGGIIAQQGFVSLPGAMAAASLGSCLADQLFFTIGRYFREGRIVRWARAKPVFARALGFVERWPIGFTFAFRFIYGFRTISPFAIGATQVPTRLFAVVNIVAAIVWGCLFTVLGYLFGHALDAWLARFEPGRETLLLAGGALAAFALLAWVVHRRRHAAR